jgi:hypothetical protein
VLPVAQVRCHPPRDVYHVHDLRHCHHQPPVMSTMGITSVSNAHTMGMTMVKKTHVTSRHVYQKPDVTSRLPEDRRHFYHHHVQQHACHVGHVPAASFPAKSSGCACASARGEARAGEKQEGPGREAGREGERELAGTLT